MKYLLKLYHFLGSIRFALFLIASTAAFVIAGTLIESATDSHRYAANLTYHHPLFLLLLWGFFINILLSALRRWPFQVKHVPFLITHLGLLMILSGVLIKIAIGVQGTMSVMEGASAHHITEAGTYSIEVEKKGGCLESLDLSHLGKQKSTLSPELHLELLHYSPHCQEHLATWIKKDHVSIRGLQPFMVFRDSEGVSAPLPVSGKARFHGEDSSVWDLYAVRTSCCEALVERLYSQHALLRMTDTSTGNVLSTTPLAEALAQPTQIGNIGELSVSLTLAFSDISGFDTPKLLCSFQLKEQELAQNSVISLNGETALLNLNESNRCLGAPPITLDITRTPFLAFIEDENKDTSLFGCSAHGEVSWQSFSSDHLTHYLAYDDGFSGYAVQTELPFPKYPTGRVERESVYSKCLSDQLEPLSSQDAILLPPLQLLKQACQTSSVDFKETLVLFLEHWNNHAGWLYPETAPLPPQISEAFQQINWHTSKENALEASQWTSKLFNQLEPTLLVGDDLVEILEKRKWPLIAEIKAQSDQGNKSSLNDNEALLTLLTRQIFSASDQLSIVKSNPLEMMTPEKQAHLLSAYFRAYGIHLKGVFPILSEEEMKEHLKAQYVLSEDIDADLPAVLLETDLIAVQQPLPTSKKLEDHYPLIALSASINEQKEILSLAYDPQAAGLKWPILEGSFKLRFQPKLTPIPYSLRLRSARQINYAGTQQAYSYEGDVSVTDLRSGERVEKTISMNHVLETWDGYRFYLSSISPGDESYVKRVQIVVNHDPAKYWLTYPGAIILTCGILLLFWMRPYQTRRK